MDIQSLIFVISSLDTRPEGARPHHPARPDRAPVDRSAAADSHTCTLVPPMVPIPIVSMKILCKVLDMVYMALPPAQIHIRRLVTLRISTQQSLSRPS